VPLTLDRGTLFGSVPARTVVEFGAAALDARFVSVRSVVVSSRAHISWGRKFRSGEVRRRAALMSALHWDEANFGSPRITISQWHAMISAHQPARCEFIPEGHERRGAAEGRRIGMRSILECLVAFAILLTLVVASYNPALGG
jgi:hypothetical protein